MSVLWINPFGFGSGSPGGGSDVAVAFANDGATNPIYSPTVFPAAFYESATDTTYFFHEAYFSGQRYGICVTYDHGTDTWSDDYPVAFVSSWLTDDDHGTPAGFRDASGYIHWFGGSHGTALRHVVSKAADDITGWDLKTAIGTTYSYPHPVFDGTTLYLFLRNDATAADRPLVVLVSTAITSGAITFASEKSLVDFGADTRFYLGNTYDDGTYIHLIATRSDGSDTLRQDIYHFRYEKSTGSLLNADGTHTVATGSQPIGLSDANTYYRIVDQSTASHYTNVPTFCTDSSGVLHLIYMDGATANGTSWDLKHMTCTSGTWSSAATVVSLTNCDRHTVQGVGPLSGGGVELLYPDNDGTYTRGGNTIKRIAYTGGSWGSASTIATDTNGNALDQPGRILGADSARMQFWEVTQSASDSGAGGLTGYAYGASLATRTIPTHDLQVTAQYSFDGANAATKTYDDSMFAAKFRPALNGNAQLSTAQQKFGTASLLLDGSGDYVQLAIDSAGHSVGNSDDKCFEAWIRPTSLAHAINTIFNKRDGGAANEFTFVVQSNGAVQAVLYASGSAVFNIASSAGAVVTNSWQHVAFTRQSGLWRIFVNGVLATSGSETTTPGSNTVALIIGKDGFTAGREFTGYIDEVRVLHGRAEYTSAFTPPAAAFAKP